MKKKILLFIVSLTLTTLMIPNVNAEEKKPTVFTIGEDTVICANGLDITIVEPEEADKDQYGAVIKYGNGKELKAVKNAWVFGGTHHDNTITTNTNITMEGGELYALVGGGLHKSSVNNSVITINGGKLQNVYGGGFASIFFLTHTAEELSHVYNGNAIDSTTRVNNSQITINSGLITNLIFGGGMGYNYTGTTKITVNGGDLSNALLTAGGANGYVKTSEVVINDGKLGKIQGVNRGSINNANITINGGTIDTAYIGGEPVEDVNGTIDSIQMTINSGKVNTLEIGTNGGETTPATDVAKLKYNKDTVENINKDDFNEQNIEETIIIKFITDKEIKNIEVKINTKLTDDEINSIITEIEKALKESGYNVDGFYIDQEYSTEFDFKNELKENTEVFIKYSKVNNKEVEENETITNPNTADTNIYMTIFIIAISAIGLTYTLKKRNFN